MAILATLENFYLHFVDIILKYYKYLSFEIAILFCTTFSSYEDFKKMIFFHNKTVLQKKICSWIYPSNCIC